MTTNNTPVFILDVPSATDLLNKQSEAKILELVLTQLGIPCIVQTALSQDDLVRASGIFNELKPRILHISAHGSDNGERFHYASGQDTVWPQICNLFPFSHDNSYIVASACNSMTNGHLPREAFKARSGKPPVAVIGFDQVVAIPYATLTFGIMHQTLQRSDRADLHASMLASYVATGTNVVATSNGGNTTVKSSELLNKLAMSVRDGDRKTFDELVTDRGLESDFWTAFWDNRESARNRIYEATKGLTANITSQRQVILDAIHTSPHPLSPTEISNVVFNNTSQ